jgi:transcription termination factor Rho
MDEVIFEEFKGTGNSEIVLDRKLADRRTYPAIDINRSATRREELLMSDEQLNRMYILRKVLAPLSPVDSMEFLVEKIKATDTNAEFMESMNS